MATSQELKARRNPEQNPLTEEAKVSLGEFLGAFIGGMADANIAVQNRQQEHDAAVTAIFKQAAQEKDFVDMLGRAQGEGATTKVNDPETGHWRAPIEPWNFSPNDWKKALAKTDSPTQSDVFTEMYQNTNKALQDTIALMSLDPTDLGQISRGDFTDLLRGNLRGQDETIRQRLERLRKKDDVTGDEDR